MIEEKMLNALNDQVNEELGSAYLYFAMASDFEARNLKGFSYWMKMQSTEEMNHAYKIYSFIQDRGGKPLMKALRAPQAEWPSPLAAFEAAYKHEQHISACFSKLMKLARELADFATENMLQWFIAEQVEEEAHADEVVKNLKMIGDSQQGLYLYDKELGARPPAQFWLVNPPQAGNGQAP